MNRKLIPHASALFSATLLLGGCTMIPEYERPALPVADSFREAAGAGASRPALGGLDEEHAPAPVTVRQQLAGELGVLELELCLDCPL